MVKSVEVLLKIEKGQKKEKRKRKNKRKKSVKPGRQCRQMSMVKSVEVLLKIEAKDDMRAACFCFVMFFLIVFFDVALMKKKNVFL